MEFLDEANANTKMRLSRTGQASSYKCDYRQIVVAALLNVLFNPVELIAASRRFDSNPFFSAVLPDGRLMPVSRWHASKIETPIINISCTDTGTSGIVASRDTGNLQQQLSLCVGVKVMLTENLWTAKRLVNGAIGTVVDLAWKDKRLEMGKRQIHTLW